MELASVSIPKAVLFSGKLTTAEIWAWLSMRGFCATKKLLYYAYSESLASKIGCTADHARAQVQSLTKKGFLSKVAVNGQWKQRAPGWKQQKTGNKRQKPTHYQLKTPDYITDKGRVDIPWLLIFRLENLPTDKLTGNEKVRLTNERAITLIIHALSKGKEVKVHCAELAGWLGLSYRTVTRLIKSVEKKGFLKVTNRKKGVSPSMISTIPAVPKVTQSKVTQVGTQGQRKVTEIGGDRSLGTQIDTSIIQTGQQHENTAVDASVTMGECRQLALFFEKKSGSFVIHDTNQNTALLFKFAKTTGLTSDRIASWMVKTLAGIPKVERPDLTLEDLLTRYKGSVGPMAENKPTNGKPHMNWMGCRPQFCREPDMLKADNFVPLNWTPMTATDWLDPDFINF